MFNLIKMISVLKNISKVQNNYREDCKKQKEEIEKICNSYLKSIEYMGSVIINKTTEVSNLSDHNNNVEKLIILCEELRKDVKLLKEKINI